MLYYILAWLCGILGFVGCFVKKVPVPLIILIGTLCKAIEGFLNSWFEPLIIISLCGLCMTWGKSATEWLEERQDARILAKIVDIIFKLVVTCYFFRAILY